MRKVLAVAVLDIRRLWLTTGAIGVALGIVPALAQGVGTKISAEETFRFVFGAAALVAGATFGSDFAEGKASFFFARPLSTMALFGGRIAALSGLAAIACLGFSASHWLSGPQSLVDSFFPITRFHLQTLAIVWVVSLFFALAAAAHTRQTATRGIRDRVFGALRTLGACGTTALMVGLFADILIRAYRSPTPMKLFFWSYVVAGFLSSCAAIELGRTNRLRIIRVLNLATYLHTALVFAAVLIAWTYVLHPGAGAIRGVMSAFSSPDGREAYVFARVDRGDPAIFEPGFRVDLGSGEVQRLTANAVSFMPGMPEESLGLWHSRDGGTEVWVEQTPLFYLYAVRRFTRSLTFHFKSSFGEAKPLQLPDGLEVEWEIGSFLPISILPSSNGDLFAVRWTDKKTGVNLAFMSPSRGQLSAINLSSAKRTDRAWAFLASGQLRVATLQQAGGGQEMEFVDIDPATGDLKTVASADAGDTPRVRFDGSATRALIVSGPASERRVSLVQLEGSPQAPGQILATGKHANLEADFLADGRVAVIVRQPPTAELRLFSPEGKPVFVVPLGGGLTTIGSEPFPNVLSVSTTFGGKSEVALIDTTSGKVLRRIAGVHAPSSWTSGASEAPPPPGSPGARILMSLDGKLYLLPSLTEEPRLLLPRP